MIEVLLIEDNPADAHLIRRLLAEASAPGFRVEHADRLSTGLHRLATEKFDAVLLDLTLPDGVGPATFTRVHAGARSVAIVVLTGLDDEELATRVLREGAQDYLVKGRVHTDSLVRCLRYAIERKQAEEERGRLLEDLRRINQELVIANLRNRELMEEAERRAGEMEAVISSIADGVMIQGPAGEVLLMNPAAEQILGYTAEHRRLPIDQRYQLLRVETPEGKPFPPEENPTLRALRGETTRGSAWLVRTPDGRRLYLSVSAAPLRGPNGTLLGAVTTFTDVTRLHAFQEYQRDLLRAISHDLRSPLTGIQGHGQLLRRLQERSAESERAKTSAEAVIANAKRMDAMIEDLADSTRLEIGQFELKKRPVDLRSLVSGLLEQTLGAMEVERVKLEIPAALPLFYADPARLERILMNLLINALKYSPSNSPVVIGAERTGGEVRVRVADGGKGIPCEDLPRIFGRFYRAETTGQAEGLGLGLYISRMLVEAHGGRIWAESEVGVGTIIHFTLPVA